jgi:hypothetical protein
MLDTSRNPVCPIRIKIIQYDLAATPEDRSSGGKGLRRPLPTLVQLPDRRW